MDRLFVLSRTWGYRDAHGSFRTQVLDGDYINKLGAGFREVTLAMVVVDSSEFEFVGAYRGALARQIRVFALKQTVRGAAMKKFHAQLTNFAAILREIRSSDHVVVFMSSLSAVWAALGARVFGKKLLLYSGNDWAADTSLKFAQAPGPLRWLAATATDRLETLVLRVADVRLVNSPQLFEKCQRLRGSSERVRPVSRFRLTDAFTREDTCRAERLRIVYPAAVIPRKNHATLLHALARLRARGVDAELLLAGAVESEQIKAELSDLTTTLGISEQVRFLGYVAGKEEMLALLRSADVFTLPSLNEGFPRVIWEAMLQSLPCAVSRIPNIVADIGQRDVTLMFDPLDADDMTTALHRIITDGELRRRLIRKGNEYACQIFAESWDEQLSRVLREWV